MRFWTILIFVVFIVLICGCSCVSKDVVLLSINTATVQNETSDAIIKSIDADMQNPARTNEEKVALQNLKDRLDYLKRSNRAISRSLMKDLDTKELAEIVKESIKYTQEEQQ